MLVLEYKISGVDLRLKQKKAYFGLDECLKNVPNLV